MASTNRRTHLEHLRLVLELLVQNGLVLNLDKCSFAQMEIEYLGHRITSDGIVPLRRHVDALLLQPHPQDVRGLQRFLGMINFYNRFLPGIAKILRPLTDALVGNPKILTWSPELQTAFQTAKSALASATSLVHLTRPPFSIRPSFLGYRCFRLSRRSCSTTTRVRLLETLSFLLRQTLRHAAKILRL